ncbi:MAG: hypothetical protein Q3963_09425, partial [Coriobacteriaceae bacterium]|nr:hypothetical protein [Coriobacteriaceae bacterium]
MTSTAEQERFFAFTDDQREYLRAGLAAEEALLSPYATRHADAVYERDGGRRQGDAPGEPSDVELVRPAFVRDV